MVRKARRVVHQRIDAQRVDAPAWIARQIVEMEIRKSQADAGAQLPRQPFPS